YSSALTEAARVRCPILIVNGRNDDNSPIPVIDAYVAKLKAADKTVTTYLPDNGPHGFYFGRPDIPETKEAARQFVAFFQARFAAAASRASAERAPAGVGQPAKYGYGAIEWLDSDRTETAGLRYA